MGFANLLAGVDRVRCLSRTHPTWISHFSAPWAFRGIHGVHPRGDAAI